MRLILIFLFVLIFGSPVLQNNLIHQTLQASEPVESLNAGIDFLESVASPSVIVVFGATGDLAARKLFLALYNLIYDGHLSEHTVIIGFARGEHTEESFRDHVGRSIEKFSRKSLDSEVWNRFKNKIFYHQSNLENDQGYENLKLLLGDIDQKFGTEGNRIYYLATPASQFITIIEKLGEHELIHSSKTSNKWSRVIVEKPFGSDLDSAINLKNEIFKYLDESQVYLMDHYLGKEGVQNLFSLRFENALFEPLWNNTFIDNVQITLSEDAGIGSRGRFWEETGYLRDIFQNHLLQLLSIIAMEKPATLNPQCIHEEKVKLLNAIRPFSLKEIDQHLVRGQYSAGSIKGTHVPGYRQENGVPENSSIETFIAAKLFIDNARWQGVPFYIRGGKRLPKQTVEVVITFKNPSQSHQHEDPNALFIRIQPNAGIFLKTLAKVPQLNKNIQPVLFGYQADSYFKIDSVEAYEKLFYDAIKGDQSLFVKPEEQLAAWRLITPILDYWNSQPQKIEFYDAGTWGPQSADQLLETGHSWHLLEI